VLKELSVVGVEKASFSNGVELTHNCLGSSVVLFLVPLTKLIPKT